MNHTPVSKPLPILREWTFPKRGLAIALLLLGFAALFGVALDAAWPTTTSVVSAGSVSDLKTNTPVHNSRGFYAVKLADGDIIALSDQDPHGYFARFLGTPYTCEIQWRPDFKFDGKTGWFRDNCTGSTFTLNGTKVFGPSPRSMDRYTVTVQDSRVLVDTTRVSQCTAADAADPSSLVCVPR